MIAKIKSCKSISGLIGYITGKQHKLTDVQGLIPGLSKAEIIAEFTRRQELNTRCKKPTSHIILSFPQEDKIDMKKADNILQDFMEQLVGRGQMWVAYEHFDRDHQHYHIALNRIQMDGTLLSDSYSLRRAMEISRDLEEKYGLRRLSSSKHKNESIRIGGLRELLVKVLRTAGNMEDFKIQLGREGIKVMTGRGIVFIDGQTGAKIKGSAIGREFSLANIEKVLEWNRGAEAKQERSHRDDINIEEWGAIDTPIHKILDGIVKSTFIPEMEQEDLDEEERKRRKRKRRR
tara:strand:- start:484 stop:1353 length:870 start_codon:yes stop_codon:yes gene_type:complete